MSAALRRTSVRPSIYGYEPQPYQQRFHEDMHKVRVFLGGNRAGKTVSGATEAVMLLSGKHPQRSSLFPTPVRGRAVGSDFESGINKIILPEIARWIPPSLLINGSWEDSYTKGERTLRLSNDSMMDFISNDQELAKMAGTSRHFVWFDEEPDQEVYNENLARTVDTKGHLWITVTPLAELSWLYDRLYIPGKQGSEIIGVHEVSTSENAYISDSEMAILVDGMGDAEKQARLTGRFLSQSGTIYKSVLSPKVFIDPVIGSESWPTMYSKWQFIGCLDHGYTNPTAFYIIAYDNEGKMIVVDEYYERGRVVEENAVAIKSLIRRHGLTNKIQYIVADPSIRNTDPITGTSIQAEYSENELYLSLANNDVKAGINRVSNRFRKNMLFIGKNCTNLCWELPRYRWDKFQSRKIADRRNAKEEPLKKDDHGCDALRYAVMSRPAILGEEEVRIGNIINASEAINPHEPFMDPEFVPHKNKESYYDETLGTDW